LFANKERKHLRFTSTGSSQPNQFILYSSPRQLYSVDILLVNLITIFEKAAIIIHQAPSRDISYYLLKSCLIVCRLLRVAWWLTFGGGECFWFRKERTKEEQK
jgi:hypothetical protein